MENIGKFIISLDFELYWGVRDKKSISNYSKNILGVHEVIPLLLDLFDNYKIKATFATVGFLYFENLEDLCSFSKGQKPMYENRNLCPYYHIENLVNKKSSFFEKLYFAPDLIKKIIDRNIHEIGSHTFSHYYCNELGQSKNEFKTDLIRAILIANKFGIQTQSIVFPRNQVNSNYLDILSDLNITCFRGIGKSFLNISDFNNSNKLWIRVLRFLDSYINITGYNCFDEKAIQKRLPLEIPASRFLRPFQGELRIFESFKIMRIINEMTFAAKNGLIYHLWWHPHNFGINQYMNIYNLNKILKHFQFLNSKYGFRNCTMGEFASYLKEKHL